MQRAFDARPIVVAELPDVVGDVVEVGRRDRMIRKQDLATRDAGFGLPAEVQDDLQELSRIDPLVESARQVGWQRAREQLDLFVPVGGADLALVLAFGLAHPNEGTSPFSRTGFGTRTASSLTNKSCVSKTVNPRPRRASIMCES